MSRHRAFIISIQTKFTKHVMTLKLLLRILGNFCNSKLYIIGMDNILWIWVYDPLFDEAQVVFGRRHKGGCRWSWVWVGVESEEDLGLGRLGGRGRSGGRLSSLKMKLFIVQFNLICIHTSHTGFILLLESAFETTVFSQGFLSGLH